MARPQKATTKQRAASVAAPEKATSSKRAASEAAPAKTTSRKRAASEAVPAKPAKKVKGTTTTKAKETTTTKAKATTTKAKATITKAKVTTSKAKPRAKSAAPVSEDPRTNGVAPTRTARPSANTSKKRNAVKEKTPAAALPLLNNDLPTIGMKVYVFGEGSAGELGLGASNAKDVSVPRLNPHLTGVTSVVTGGMHGAALNAKNTLLTWGQNDEKALGRNTAWDGGLKNMSEGKGDSDDDSDDDGALNPLEATPTSVPIELPSNDNEIAQVVASDSATFILTRAGNVYGWGTFRDMSGIFGFTLDDDKKIVKVQATPLLIPNLKKIRSLSVGADFVLALDHSGQVWAWGCGQQNQLGRRIVARRVEQTLLPFRVELPKKHKFVSIHTGNDHAFAVDEAGDTWAWGLNNFAQTGITHEAGEEDASVVIPRIVPSLRGKNIKMIEGGRHHSIGLTKDGEVLVWGRMDGCQSGLDTATLPIDDETKVLIDYRGRPRVLLEPFAVPIPKGKHVAAGPDHCIAVTEEGKAYSWGFNVNYQCGQGTSDDIPIAKLMNGKAIRETKLTWAGCGGQYSMVGAAETS